MQQRLTFTLRFWDLRQGFDKLKDRLELRLGTKSLVFQGIECSWKCSSTGLCVLPVSSVCGSHTKPELGHSGKDREDED